MDWWNSRQRDLPILEIFKLFLWSIGNFSLFMSFRMGHFGVSVFAHPNYKRSLYKSYHFSLLLELFGNLNIENRWHKDQKNLVFLYYVDLQRVQGIFHGIKCISTLREHHNYLPNKMHSIFFWSFITESVKISEGYILLLLIQASTI